MTREQVERVRRFFEPYGNQPGYGPALELVEHTTELQALVCDLAEQTAGSATLPPDLLRRLHALRQKVEPLKGAR